MFVERVTRVRGRPVSVRPRVGLAVSGVIARPVTGGPVMG